MKKVLYLFILTVFVLACSNPVVENSPETLPDSSRLDVLIYTIDSVTPAGPITLISYNTDTGSSESFVMEKGNSTISGITLWTAAVPLGNLGTDTLNLSISNSDGNTANGLLNKVDPWWRNVNNDNYDPYEIIDDVLGIYEYKELIRHWNTTSAGRTINFTGNIVDETGQDITGYDLEVIPFHGVSTQSSFGYSMPATENVSSASFTFPVADIQTIDSETLLPFTDFLDINAVKNFYTPQYNSIDYSDLHGVSDYAIGEIVFVANKKITFDWILSADSQFSTADSTTTSIVNTVARWDFQDYGLADYFYDSFSDNLLDDDLNTYYFDTNHTSGMDLYTSYSDSAVKTTLHAFGGVAEITDLTGTVSFPADIDLSGNYTWTWGIYLDSTPGQIFGIKTDYGYALVEITAIETMTTTDMETVVTDYNASQASPAPANMPQIRATNTENQLRK